MKVYLVRHGETESNSKKIIQGQANTKLNDIGKRQAENIASVLQNKGIKKIYSSDLLRAKETAEIINNSLKVNINFTSQLRELDMGEWEGKSFVELQKSIDFEKWVVRPTSFDQIRKGESLFELRQRIKTFLDTLKNEKENVLVVTHGIALTTFILLILDSSMDNIWRVKVHNASLSVIQYIERFDTWSIERFNDFNHNIEYYERDVYNF